MSKTKTIAVTVYIWVKVPADRKNGDELDDATVAVVGSLKKVGLTRDKDYRIKDAEDVS